MSEFKFVPARMLLDKETIGAINFHCGDGVDGQFGEYSDGLLWVGIVTDDEGKEVHGLHLATAEYPEEGSTTLVEFAAPAQPEGDAQPAALAIPEECPHLIVFDDAQVENIMFAGAGARTAALKKWEAISNSWNAHLFVRVARNSRDDGHLCATAAGTGEIERLTAERDQQRLRADTAEADAANQRELKLELAERVQIAEDNCSAYREQLDAEKKRVANLEAELVAFSYSISTYFDDKKKGLI